MSGKSTVYARMGASDIYIATPSNLHFLDASLSTAQAYLQRSLIGPSTTIYYQAGSGTTDATGDASVVFNSSYVQFASAAPVITVTRVQDAATACDIHLMSTSINSFIVKTLTASETDFASVPYNWAALGYGILRA